MNIVNVVVLAAGNTDFNLHDGEYPLCLTEINGHPLLELVAGNLSHIPNARFTFALKSDEIAAFHLDKIASLLVPGASVVSVPPTTLGSACTALLAASTLSPEEEVLFVSANELVDVRIADVIAQFRESGLDGGTLTFPSVHPRYSYVRLNKNDEVVEVSQRVPISKRATVGVFWAARTNDMVEAIKQMIRKDASIDGRYYIAKAFNEMILKQKRIGIYDIDPQQYHPLKTERQFERFKETELVG